MYKYSIITVCLNVQDTIEKTITSVLNQSYNNFEYIIVDGESKDGTHDIINQYLDNINIFLSEPDIGIYNAMNKGLRFAKGEYVLFLNSGDYFANNNVLQKMFEMELKADILHGYMQTPSGENIKNIPEVNIRKYVLKNTLPHQATFVKKTVFDKTNGFDETYKIAGDYDFFAKAILQYKSTTKFVPLLISIFNYDGVARNNPGIRKQEKQKVQQKAKLFEKKKRYINVIPLKLKKKLFCKANNLNNFNSIPNPPIFDKQGLFIFYPNNKCGQISITGGGKLKDQRAALFGRCIVKKHNKKEWKRYSKKNWDNALKFTIVRHPYARFLSTYRYLRKFYDYNTLDIFFQKIEQDGFFDPHLQPQWTSAFDLQGNLFIDYIINLENINEQWELIQTKIKADPIPKLNTTMKNESNSVLTIDQKQKIYDLYKNDFLQFKFEK